MPPISWSHFSSFWVPVFWIQQWIEHQLSRNSRVALLFFVVFLTVTCMNSTWITYILAATGGIAIGLSTLNVIHCRDYARETEARHQALRDREAAQLEADRIRMLQDEEAMEEQWGVSDSEDELPQLIPDYDRMIREFSEISTQTLLQDLMPLTPQSYQELLARHIDELEELVEKYLRHVGIFGKEHEHDPSNWQSARFLFRIDTVKELLHGKNPLAVLNCPYALEFPQAHPPFRPDRSEAMIAIHSKLIQTEELSELVLRTNHVTEAGLQAQLDNDQSDSSSDEAELHGLFSTPEPDLSNYENDPRWIDSVGRVLTDYSDPKYKFGQEDRKGEPEPRIQPRSWIEQFQYDFDQWEQELQQSQLHLESENQQLQSKQQDSIPKGAETEGHVKRREERERIQARREFIRSIDQSKDWNY